MYKCRSQINNNTKELEQVVVQPYIFFNGNCREAIDFYAKVFKTGKAKIMA